MKWKFKDDSDPFELITCPYCGSRLNRIDNELIPTSCSECKHDRFKPTIRFVKVVVEK